MIPLAGYIPQKFGYDLDKLKITLPGPIVQSTSKRENGVYFYQTKYTKKKMTLRQFRGLASTDYRTPEHFEYQDLESKYWDNITRNKPMYGSDVPGSLTDNDVTCRNIGKLGTILDEQFCQ